MQECTIPLKAVTKVVGLESVDSTQTVASALALQGAQDGTLVLACEQTAGLCRDGKPFSAAEGGVYFTLILRPENPLAKPEDLCAQTAEAVAETVAHIFGIKTKTHGEGDVLAWSPKKHAYKKLTGVWVQPLQKDCLLVGVGIHVNDRLSAKAKDTDVTLKQLIGAETSKELFLDEILNAFFKRYAYWLCAR